MTSLSAAPEANLPGENIAGIPWLFCYTWLVVLTILKNHGVKVSWDYAIPNIWKVIKNVPVTANKIPCNQMWLAGKSLKNWSF